MANNHEADSHPPYLDLDNLWPIYSSEPLTGPSSAAPTHSPTIVSISRSLPSPDFFPPATSPTTVVVIATITLGSETPTPPRDSKHTVTENSTRFSGIHVPISSSTLIPASTTSPTNAGQADGIATMDGRSSSRDTVVTIVVATTVPGVLILMLAVFLYRRFRRRRSSSLFKRGITPIDDDEIESWKADKGEEKSPVNENKATVHGPHNSVGSIQKPASVIVYHNRSQSYPRISEDIASRSPFDEEESFEMPTSPITARAPNARPGLTDEAIQGDDAFLPTVRRQQSRLVKSQSGLSRHSRGKSGRSIASMAAVKGHWSSQSQEFSVLPRPSVDTSPWTAGIWPPGHRRAYSNSSNPVGASFDEYDDVGPGGLSPRPLIRKSEIGRAIG